MISKKMVPFVEGSSVVRAMFEEGKRMAEEFGPENVYKAQTYGKVPYNEKF